MASNPRSRPPNRGKSPTADTDRRVMFGVAALLAIIIVLVGLFALLANNENGDDQIADSTATESATEGDTQEDVTVTEEEETSEATETEEADSEPDAEPTEESTGEPTDAPAETEEPAETAEPTATEPPSTEESDFAYGFNVAWRADEGAEEFNVRARDAVLDADFNWVRIQVQWSEVERAKDQWDPLPIDLLVDNYASEDVNILLSIVQAPEWAVDPTEESLLANYEDFAGFMHFMAERYQGRVQAWQIWNEQNLAHEMRGTVRLEDYARLLEAGYRGVKQADPDALVVFGGLTPTGISDPLIAINDIEYLEQFYELDDGYFAQFFDVMGMHLNATNNPPHTMWPDDPGPGEWSGDGSFYFRRGEQLHDVMQRVGDDRPTWVTEFGWTTENQAPGYEYGADVTEEQQAEYLVGAFEWVDNEWPWITGMFVWNLNFSTLVGPEDEKYPWSVLNEDWTPRPAYEVLRDMPKR